MDEDLALRWHADNMAKYRLYLKWIEINKLEDEYEKFKEKKWKVPRYKLPETFYEEWIKKGGSGDGA